MSTRARASLGPAILSITGRRRARARAIAWRRWGGGHGAAGAATRWWRPAVTLVWRRRSRWWWRRRHAGVWRRLRWWWWRRLRWWWRGGYASGGVISRVADTFSGGGHVGGGGPHYAGVGHYAGGAGYSTAMAGDSMVQAYAGGYRGGYGGAYGHSGAITGTLGIMAGVGTPRRLLAWRVLHGGFWPRAITEGFSCSCGAAIGLRDLLVGRCAYYYASDVYYTLQSDYEGYVATDPRLWRRRASPPMARGGCRRRPATAGRRRADLHVPENGQSAEQQATDKAECQEWAQQAGRAGGAERVGLSARDDGVCRGARVQREVAQDV